MFCFEQRNDAAHNEFSETVLVTRFCIQLQTPIIVIACRSAAPKQRSIHRLIVEPTTFYNKQQFPLVFTMVLLCYVVVVYLVYAIASYGGIELNISNDNRIFSHWYWIKLW